MLKAPMTDERQRRILQQAADLTEALRMGKAMRRVNMGEAAVEYFLKGRRIAAQIIEEIGEEVNPANDEPENDPKAPVGPTPPEVEDEIKRNLKNTGKN